MVYWALLSCSVRGAEEATKKAKRRLKRKKEKATHKKAKAGDKATAGTALFIGRVGTCGVHAWFDASRLQPKVCWCPSWHGRDKPVVLVRIVSVVLACYNTVGIP